MIFIFLILSLEIEDYLNAIKYKTPASAYAKDSIIKKGEELIPLLLKILKDKKEDINYRIEICQIVGKIKSKNSIKILSELLKEEHPGLRKEAVRALGEIGDTSSFSSIIKTLDDPHDMVRREGIIALRNINDKRGIFFLRKLLLKERDYSNISEILRTFGYFKAKESLNEIFYFLKAKEENIKISAIYAIGEIGEAPPEIIDTLIEFLEKESDYIKKEIISAIGKMKVKKTLPKIAKFIHSNNITLKKEALNSISNIEDEDVIFYLLEATFDKDTGDFAKEILKNRKNIEINLEKIMENEKIELKIKKGAFEILKEIYPEQKIIPILKKIFPEREREIYELIIKGKIKKGMKEEEVFFSKGNPRRVAFYKEKNKKEWEYEDMIIEFEGEKVTYIKIKN